MKFGKVLSPRDLAALATPPPGSIASRGDAMHLLSAFLGLPRQRLLLEPTRLSPWRHFRLTRRLRRLWRGEPLAYLIGTQPFGDMELAVDGRVLIPRPETEDLFELAAPFARGGLRALDVGTGSGCLAIALKRHEKALDVVAVDKSRGALSVAQKNARGVLGPDHGIAFHRLDFLDGRLRLSLGPFDLLVSNPPYVAEGEKGEMDPSVLRYEPRGALFSGGDGLFFIRALVAALPDLVNPGGHVFLEVGHRQGPQVGELLEKAGNFHYSIMADHRGVGRLIHGWRA